MNTRHAFRYLVVLVAFLATSPITTFVVFAESGPDVRRLTQTPSSGGPCALAMMDNHLYASGTQIPVYVVHTRLDNCPGALFVQDAVMYSSLWLTLQRRVVVGFHQAAEDSEWETISGNPLRLMLGQDVRERMAVQYELPDGKYRVLLIAGTEPGPWYYLGVVNFTVGSTEDGFDPELRMPYVKSARTAYGGKLFFEGQLFNGFATGFLYQVQTNRTEILSVQFRQAGTRIVVELPNNSLDTSRPVYASVTADGGGITIQGIVFDPTDPDANVEGFNASR